MSRDVKHKVFMMTPERINTLSDGVFAIVMTILILDIKIDKSPDANDAMELISKLWGLLPRIEVYIVSFLILGLFWISHHSQFHYIKRNDLKLLWINIFFLMFVSILPFSTDIAGEFTDHNLSLLILSSNLLIVNILLSINWRYATYKHRLVDPQLSNDLIKLYNRKNVTTSIVFLVAIIMFHFEVRHCYLIYVVTPFVHWYYTKKILEYHTN